VLILLDSILDLFILAAIGSAYGISGDRCVLHVAHDGMLDEGVSFIQKPFWVQDSSVKA